MGTQIFPAGFVENELAWWKIPGVTIGIVRADDNGHGEPLLLAGYGERDCEAHLPMTGGTLGGIASCSKAFTSAVAAALVDEGKLSFDTPVREYIPEFRLWDDAASDGCTVRDMLYHRTGIAGHDAMWPHPGQSRENYLRAVRYLEPNKPFRSIAQYSNTIYDLVGCIEERVSGETWENLVRTRILDPLGMKRTCLSIRDLEKDPDHAAGYFNEDVGPESDGDLRRMPGWDMAPIGNPAAGVNSCAEEMLHWITMHISGGFYEGKGVLSQSVTKELHEPGVVMSPFPWRFPEVPGFGLYGMAWKTAVYRSMRLVYHCGEIEGYCSITAFLPDARLGFFLLCNRHTMMTPFLLTLVYTAIDRILGFPAVDWPARLHAYAHDFTESCAAWKADLMTAPEDRDGKIFAGAESTGAHRSAARPAPDPVLPPADCAGVYESHAYGRLEIRKGPFPEGTVIGVPYMKTGRTPAAGEYYLLYRHWILPVEPWDGDTFRVENLKEDTLFYTIPLTFMKSPETGRVTGFDLKLERTVPAVPFVKITS